VFTNEKAKHKDKFLNTSGLEEVVKYPSSSSKYKTREGDEVTKELNFDSETTKVRNSISVDKQFYPLP
jgi:hypothetical protein